MPPRPHRQAERAAGGSAVTPLRRVVGGPGLPGGRPATSRDGRPSVSPLVPPGIAASGRVPGTGGSGQAFDALVHLAAALSAHERRLRRDGTAVPVVFADLARLLCELVRVRHDATELSGPRNRPHDGSMTERAP